MLYCFRNLLAKKSKRGKEIEKNSFQLAFVLRKINLRVSIERVLEEQPKTEVNDASDALNQKSQRAPSAGIRFISNLHFSRNLRRNKN